MQNWNNAKRQKIEVWEMSNDIYFYQNFRQDFLLNRPQTNLDDNDWGDAGGGRQARAQEEQDQREAGAAEQITSKWPFLRINLSQKFWILNLQCDQIGRFFKVLGENFSFENSPNVLLLLGYFENILFQ